jgi:hypothetical protein
VPPRIRKMLELWVEHRMDQCRLDHWTTMCIPDLDVTPYFDSAKLGFDPLFEAAYEELRKEAKQIADKVVRAPHYGVSVDEPDAPIRGRPDGWRNWTFVEDFVVREDSKKAFPAAGALIAKISELTTVCHASFLVMEPGCVLRTHSDAAGWVVSYNYGLIVPPECHITVARERRHHRERASLTFNDSFIHRAANESDATRILLQIVCANPLLDREEQRAMREVSEILPKGALIYAIQGQI